jgi:sugar phosphate isomerase/epimerase
LSYKFQSISLDIVEFASDVQTFGMPHARRFIDSAKIKIATFHLPLTGEDWEANDKTFQSLVDQLPKFAELSTQLGCTRCTTALPPASDSRPYHENFEFLRKRIGDVAKVLGDRNIRLGLEVVCTPEERQGRAFQFIHTFDAMLQLAKMIAPNVGVVADLWQMHIGGAGVVTLRNVPRERLVAIYLSGAPIETDFETITEAARLMPGETGAIDSAAALASLAEMEYDGPVTARVAPEHLPGKNRDEKIRLVAEQLAKLWANAGLNAAGRLAAEASR